MRTPVSLSAGFEGLLTGWAQHEVETDCCAYETVACVTCVTSVHGPSSSDEKCRDCVPCKMDKMWMLELLSSQIPYHYAGQLHCGLCQITVGLKMICRLWISSFLSSTRMRSGGSANPTSMASNRISRPHCFASSLSFDEDYCKSQFELQV